MSDESRVIYSDGQKYERGVGIIQDKEKSKCAMGYWQLSDRVLLVKLRGRPFNISIIIVCAPTSDSSEQEMDQFYNTLDNAKLQCKSQEINIVMGDLNAKVGEEQDSDVAGKHGLGTRSERGERWVQWCTANDQIITNTWFENHPRRLWTWRSPGGDVKNQIDYLTINKRFRNAVQHSKTYPGADCGSDHLPVICKLKVKLQKLKKPRMPPKLQYDTLRNNTLIRQAYTEGVKNRFQCLEDEGEGLSKWNIMQQERKAYKKQMDDKRDS